MKSKRHAYAGKATGVVILTSVLSLGLPAFGQSQDINSPTATGPPDFDLSWHTVDGGGVMFATAGDYELSATIGQPDAREPVISGQYELTGGFWFAQVPGDCVFDGAVNLLDYIAFTDCVTGPVGIASAGDLDPTFGTGGFVTTDFASESDGVLGLAVQADGKFVAAGWITDAGETNFGLARYNTDGILDPTFGTGGLVTTNFAAGSNQAVAVAIQGDDKIVAGGVGRIDGVNEFALIRYNTDGTLDTTFDTDGLVTTDFGPGSSGAFSLAIQGNGKIVAAGHFNTSAEFALARYNADGGLDPTFNTDGKVTTDFGFGHATAYAVAIQADGKVVVAGHAFTGSTDDFALARYNTNGSLDTTFGTGGLVTTDFAADFDVAFAVAIQGDGKLLAVGWAVNGATNDADFALARYNTNGSLDTSFGTGGLVTTDFSGVNDRGRSVAIQGDGKIVVAGLSILNIELSTSKFAMARYHTDGSLDTTFGTGGLVNTDFTPDNDRAFALVIQGDGKLVAAGLAFTGGSNNFALARYLTMPTTDPEGGAPLEPGCVCFDPDHDNAIDLRDFREFQRQFNGS